MTIFYIFIFLAILFFGISLYIFTSSDGNTGIIIIGFILFISSLWLFFNAYKEYYKKGESSSESSDSNKYSSVSDTST